jgi:AbrB family looped-hinge helix DNA binding protein
MRMVSRQKQKVLLESVTVSEKGQISIPMSVRESLSIKKGDKLVVIVSDDKMLLQKSDEAGSKMQKEFDYLLKLSEKSAKRLWENEKDNVWNDV